MLKRRFLANKYMLKVDNTFYMVIFPAFIEQLILIFLDIILTLVLLDFLGLRNAGGVDSAPFVKSDRNMLQTQNFPQTYTTILSLRKSKIYVCFFSNYC